jgi:prepilin-type N-terminal cleavage/methylation domain-containing protein
MINKKVASFTLIEVTIAMLIASVLISITYTAYTIVAKLYSDFTAKQEKASNVTLLNKLVNMDFLSGEKIIRTPDGFQVNSQVGKIHYIVTKDFIVRDQFSLRTDTFSISIPEKVYYFQKQQVESGGIIDEVHLSIFLSGYVIPLNYYKQYSSQNLFE